MRGPSLSKFLTAARAFGEAGVHGAGVTGPGTAQLEKQQGSKLEHEARVRLWKAAYGDEISSRI